MWSYAYSRGRNGYGKEYKLKMDPSIVGPAVGKEWWDGMIQNKKKQEDLNESIENLRPLGTPLAKRYSRIFDKYRNL